jgi:hypothetical protein
LSPIAVHKVVSDVRKACEHHLDIPSAVHIRCVDSHVVSNVVS